jgi:TatD DNase family protein
MIDTHGHLTDPRLLDQIDAVLERAKAAGIGHIITIGTDPDDSADAITLCRMRPNLSCVVGIHPGYCHEVEEAEVQTIARLQFDPAVVAIGEMGLDYHYGTEHKDRQRRFFQAQLDLAQRMGKPAVIHSRESVEDCLAILRDFPKVPAVFHCFTGTIEEGRQILAAGYYLGFTGVVTFKNAEHLRRLAGEMPADRILVETDAPYLSPEPMRKQKVNEPALVIHTAAAVAAARGMSLEALDALTTQNAARLFGRRIQPPPAG